MPEALHPLRFKPRLVPKMWGGRRLASLGKNLPDAEPVGESWELYDFPPGVVDSGWTSATVAEGSLAGKTLHDLMADDDLRHRILGHAEPVDTEHGPQFPLLIKFLDAAADLSVQVHPDTAYAEANPGAHLKNETWYILRHEPDARLLKGLEAGVTREALESAIADGTVEKLITALPARVGDCHYLPSGTVHALGAGMLVAEVQTPSDTTYRVYDFQRKDPKTGQERQLHVDQALECIDFSTAGTNPTPPRSGDGVLTDAPQFTLRRTSASAGSSVPLPQATLAVVILVEGQAHLAGDDVEPRPLACGDTLLVPAEMTGATIHATIDAAWLITTLPG
jgi:mannose-6-phosphate isomerase